MRAPDIKKSRRSMLLVLAAFMLPVLLAKLALQQHWFNYGVTNKGELLQPGVTLAQLGLDVTQFEHKWLMIYLPADQCLQQCDATLHSVNNTYVALGEEMNRVIPLVLSKHQLSETQKQQLSAHAWQTAAIGNAEQGLLAKEQVLIVDPLGNVVLSHKPPAQAEQLPAFGKAILADFKKLLKYSRIG